MLSTAVALSLLAAVTNAEIAQMYQQCGGIGWKGATECAYPATCYSQNAFYYQCTTVAYVPEPTTHHTSPTVTPSPSVIYWNNTITEPASSFSTTSAPLSTSNTQVAGMWGQCGGEGWMGPTLCAEPATCFSQNPWYYQCTTFPSTETQKTHHTTTTSSSTHHTTTHHTKPESTKVASMWAQCGGLGWKGATKCAEPATCYSQNAFYYQCTTFPSTKKEEHHTSTKKKSTKTKKEEHHTKTSHKAHPQKPTSKPHDDAHH